MKKKINDLWEKIVIYMILHFGYHIYVIDKYYGVIILFITLIVLAYYRSPHLIK